MGIPPSAASPAPPAGSLRGKGHRGPMDLRYFFVVRPYASKLATADNKKAPQLRYDALSLVEHRGFEPLTYRLRTYRSTN